LCVSALALLAAVTGSGAKAQTAPPPGSAATVSEVIVTAQKRAEKLQNVPLAVSAVTGAQIQEDGAADVRDLVQSAPSISMVGSSPETQKVVMRGISSGGVRDAANAATGFYLNDVPLASGFTSGGTDLDLYDVARMEVLRGPQGTLFGGGSMGGTVRIITNDPNTQSYSASADLTGSEVAGRAGGMSAHAMVNLPIIRDQLALRLVGAYRDQAGYINDPVTGRNGVNGNTLGGGRAELKWTPNDRLGDPDRAPPERHL
jgi:outer membrane receptor protein involved in Fe transport